MEVAFDLSPPAKAMNRLAIEISAEVAELMSHYGFDLGGYSLKALVDYWMTQYPAPWIRLATIEALYQGRYKAISIEQILNLWRRRTRTLYHFNSEFERMISLRPMLNPTPLTAAPDGQTAADNRNALPDRSEAFDAETLYTETLYTETVNSAQQSLDDTPNSADRPSWQSSGSAIDSGEIRRISGGEPAPIDQFTPTLDASDFYWRLKAVMQTVGAGTTEGIGGRN